MGSIDTSIIEYHRKYFWSNENGFKQLKRKTVEQRGRKQDKTEVN